jgi:hypothetical protein
VNATTSVTILRTGSPALSVAALATSGNVYAKSAYQRPYVANDTMNGEVTVRVLSGSFTGFRLFFQINRSVGGATMLGSSTFPITKGKIVWSTPAPADTTSVSLMTLGIAVAGVGDSYAVDQANLQGIPLSLAPAQWVQGPGNNAVFGTVNADTVDQYGDPVDLLNPAASGVPFSILEQQSNEMDPSTGESRVVRFVLGRCYPGVDLKRGDRVRDERTGVLYAVDGVTRPQSPVGTPDLRSELRQLGG